MATVLNISPVTRVEGHLEVQVTVDAVGGRDEVVDAKVVCTEFRGFEIIMVGRDPRDAVHYTQRVCGVCPVSHAMASSLTLEDAFGVSPPDNGRILRNLGLGANYLQSHILHFYHLTAPDYLDTEGLLDMSPWKPRYSAPDLVGGDAAAALVGHYVQALAMRRKAHQMGAIFGGRLPGIASFVPGGASETVNPFTVGDFRALLNELRDFIDNVYVPDVQALADLFPDYLELGAGCGNLLAYGVFEGGGEGGGLLLARGRYTDGAYGDVDTNLIREYVGHSWYSPETSGRNPGEGVTEPTPGAGTDAYTWVKAPRYEDTVHEVGPLARMWMNGDYRRGISVMDRLVARALETKKVADAMAVWLDQIVPGPVYNHAPTPATAVGVGLTEAPRGALGHWISIEDSRIARYQIVTPTAWNASPRDDAGQRGALEQALVGTPVSDMSQPLEVLRVVHSVDPCLACSVHMVRPGAKGRQMVVPAGMPARTIRVKAGRREGA